MRAHIVFLRPTQKYFYLFIYTKIALEKKKREEKKNRIGKGKENERQNVVLHSFTTVKTFSNINNFFEFSNQV